MSTEQLEQRVAELEKALAGVQLQLAALSNGNGVAQPWPPPMPPQVPLPLLTPEEQEAADYVAATNQYYRHTGKEPPPDWKPGDPIPDPEWWS